MGDSLLTIIIGIIVAILIGLIYPRLKKHYRRPIFALIHFYRVVHNNDAVLGVSIKNCGLDAATEVHGEIRKDTSIIPIIWEPDVLGRTFGRDSGRVDIYPGDRNSRQFYVKPLTERWSHEEIIVYLEWVHNGEPDKDIFTPKNDWDSCRDLGRFKRIFSRGNTI